jgi:hypothetical protein
MLDAMPHRAHSFAIMGMPLEAKIANRLSFAITPLQFALFGWFPVGDRRTQLQSAVRVTSGQTQ